MQVTLDQFGDDQAFKHCPPRGMIGQVRGVRMRQKVAEQASVEEVELGALDEPLAEIAVMRT